MILLEVVELLTAARPSTKPRNTRNGVKGMHSYFMYGRPELSQAQRPHLRQRGACGSIMHLKPLPRAMKRNNRLDLKILGRKKALRPLQSSSTVPRFGRSNRWSALRTPAAKATRICSRADISSGIGH
jgi:hypothetical protein